jgi:hypothetical protein
LLTETDKRKVSTIQYVENYVQNFSPGVWLINITNGSMIPIFQSMTDLNIIGFEDCADKILVFPNYTAKIYTNKNYDTNEQTITGSTTDNKILFTTLTYVDDASSIKIYFNNVEINNRLYS